MIKPIQFTGNEYVFLSGNFTELMNSFTLEFWVNTEYPQSLDSNLKSMNGKRFVFGTYCPTDSEKAIVGISVGTNGITIVEQSQNGIAIPLNCKIKINGWTHIAIVYTNNTPLLFVDGKFITKGKKSSHQFVSPTFFIGGMYQNSSFIGELKGIRAWNCIRSESQIREGIKEFRDPNLETCTLSWEDINSEIISNGIKREIEISVIIPTYNKYPQNLFTLYSLENQEFDLSKVEVILIDDGSSDLSETIFLNHKFSFLLKYIKCNQNIGRPAARNLGIKNSTGKILVFLDAEIIVEPNCLKIHHQYHQKDDNLVLTGVMTIKALFSVFYPGFSQYQLQQLEALIQQYPELKARYETIQKNPQITPLIERLDVLSNNYKKLSFTTPFERYYQEIIISNYGYELTNYRIPWQLFGTGHVSVSKKSIEKVGLFTEYSGYGWDDCEMGYRLYADGCKFQSDLNLVSYHQEHPISTTNNNDSRQNYYRFQETYNDVAQMIISLTFIPTPKNLHEINQIFIEYQKLCTDYPGDFLMIKKIFGRMLRKIGSLYEKNSPISQLCIPSLGQDERESIAIEKTKLKQSKNYDRFIQCFEQLECL